MTASEYLAIKTKSQALIDSRRARQNRLRPRDVEIPPSTLLIKRHQPTKE